MFAFSSANRNQTCAICERIARVCSSLVERAISKHPFAKRRYSTELVMQGGPRSVAMHTTRFPFPPLANKSPQKRTPNVTARGSCCLSGPGGGGPVGGWGAAQSSLVTTTHRSGSITSCFGALIQSPRRRHKHQAFSSTSTLSCHKLG